MRITSTQFVLLAAVLVSCCVPFTLGHTYFDSIIVNGVNHKECMRPSRSYEKENPIDVVTSPDMTCGFLPAANQRASAKLTVAAGSPLTLQWWHTQPGDDVVADTHKGPCMIYLAKSDTGAGPVWFKIYENGLDIATQTWCVDTLIQNRGKLPFTLPADLTPGNYLLRGEVVALHNGHTIDGAQPYVGCAELTITGNGQSSPPSSSLVSIPGTYKNTDPGFYPVSLYNGPLRSYIIPGPPVWGKSSSPAAASAATVTGSVVTGDNNNNNPTPAGSSSGPAGGGGGSATIPTSSSAATCGAVTISTKLRAGASWGNPPHNIYDISVTNGGSSDIRDLVIKITLNPGATNLDEVWNMAKTTTGNYWFSEVIKAGKTYTGAGYIITAGDAKVQTVCASSSYTGEYGYSSSSSSAAAAASSTTGTNTYPSSTTGTVTPPPPPPASTTGTQQGSTTGTVTPPPNNNNDASCRAGISFTLSNSWNNGGMVGIVISNTGTKAIKNIQVRVNIDKDSWNLLGTSTSRVYTLPPWSFPIAAGARFDAAGYTFSGTLPAPGSVVSVTCD